MEGGGWYSFAAPLPDAHPRPAGPLLLRPLQVKLNERFQSRQISTLTLKYGLPLLSQSHATFHPRRCLEPFT